MLLGLLSICIAIPIVLALEKLWFRITVACLYFSAVCVVAFYVDGRYSTSAESDLILPSSDHFLLAIILVPLVASLLVGGAILYLRIFRKTDAEANDKPIYDKMWWNIRLNGIRYSPARISVYKTFMVLKTVVMPYIIPLKSIRSMEKPVGLAFNRTEALHVHPKNPAQFPSIELRGKKSAILHKAVARLMKQRKEMR